jgi:hypothetical protein
LVVIEPEEGLAPGLLAEFVSNVVLAILLEQRGAFVLHASAVEMTDGVVVAFTGPSGAGKSTTAGFFASRGFALVSDDLLPLSLAGDDVVCELGPEVLKFTENTAAALPGLTPDAELSDKRLHAPARRRRPSARRNVAALYVLEDGSEIAIRPMRGQAAVGALLDASFCLNVIGPARRGPLLLKCARIAHQIRISTLARPRDWACAGALVDKVEADVAGTVQT